MISAFDALLVKDGDIPVADNVCDRCQFFHYTDSYCGLFARHVRSSYYRLKECREKFRPTMEVSE